MNYFNLFNPNSNLYTFFEWVWHLLYVNVLWLLLTLLGLVIGGIGPATVTMFTILQKPLNEVNSTFSLFWKTYKDKFIKSNIIFYLTIIIGGVLYYDWQFFNSQKGYLHLLSYIFFTAIFFYIIGLIYIFPVNSHYDELKIVDILKNSLFMSLLAPVQTILMLLGIIIILLIFSFLPSLIPFFGVSSFAFLLTKISAISFNKVEKKIKENKEGNK